MRHTRRILTAVLTAGALVLAGCGSADDTAESAAAPIDAGAEDTAAQDTAAEDTAAQDAPAEDTSSADPAAGATEPSGAEASQADASETEASESEASGVEGSAENGTDPSAENSADPSVDDSVAQGSPVVDEAALAEVRAGLPKKAPERVVTLSVGITEILMALGVTPAGVPESEMTLPDGLDDVPRVGNSVQPDLESIAQIGPDLVLNPSSIHESLDGQLAPLDLQTAKVPTDSIDDLTISTLALGDLFGATDTAEELVTGLASTEAAATEKAGDLSNTKVLLLFGSPESLMVMSSNTYAGEIVTRLGAGNVADDLGLTETYTPFSMESVVETDPDVILVIAHGDEADAQQAIEEFLAGQDAWQSLSAAKNDAVSVLPFSVYGVASITRADEAFDRMAQALTR